MNTEELKGSDAFLNRSNKHLTGLLLIFLILLRGSITIARLLQYDINPILASLYEGITYLTIIFLIVINRKQLALFRIDRASLWLILFGISFFRPTFKGEPLILFFLLFGIGIWLILYLKKNQITLPKISTLWLFTGLATGSSLSILLKLPFLHSFSNPENITRFILILLASFNSNLSHAAVIEEPIFRGFLWGYLQSSGWEDKRILLFQAFLFWMVHLNFISQPYTLLVQTPIASIIFGILVLRSGSIAPAILAHAVYNALSDAIYRQ